MTVTLLSYQFDRKAIIFQNQLLHIQVSHNKKNLNQEYEEMYSAMQLKLETDISSTLARHATSNSVKQCDSKESS